jgi:hypothetical protein
VDCRSADEHDSTCGKVERYARTCKPSADTEAPEATPVMNVSAECS